ncbi:hypothetical protein ABPG72_012210 [Tetrahymena utriculariae]
MLFSVKFLAFFLALLSLSTSQHLCHKSCTCDDNTYNCNGCSSPFGDPSQLWYYDYRYCPCADGFYVSDNVNWTCSPNPVADDFDWCEEQLVFQILQIIVNTDCHSQVDNGVNYVESNINLDYNGMIAAGGCLYDFRSSLLYKDPTQPGNPYVPFPNDIVQNGDDATKIGLKILLSDVSKYSISNTIDNAKGTINNEIHVGINIGHDRKVIRLHEYVLYVYTNRNEVMAFNVDVDMQRTQDCTPGSCIIVADLDVSGKLYTDNTYSKPLTSLNYIVGDTLYGQINFIDPSYTKELIFQSLFIKTDHNSVYDMSSLVKATPIKGGMQFEMKLVYPSISQVIQVNMKIQGLRRFLDAKSQATPTPNQVINQQYKIQVVNPITKTSSSQDPSTNNTNSSSLLRICLISLLLLLF